MSFIVAIVELRSYRNVYNSRDAEKPSQPVEGPAVERSLFLIRCLPGPE